MKKIKSILLRFLSLVLALFSVFYLGIPASALTLDTDNKTISGEKSIGYSSATGFEIISGSNTSKKTNLSDGTTSNIAPNTNSDGTVTFNLAAVSSYKYDEGAWIFTKTYYAQNGYATLTFTNSTSDTLKISYKDATLSGLNASGDFYLTPSGTANATITFTLRTSTTADATSSVKATGSITITEISVAQALDINFFSSKYCSYTYSVDTDQTGASGSVAVGTEATSSSAAASTKAYAGAAITASATIADAYKDTYQFYCWMSDGKVLSTNASLECEVTDTMNIYPVYLPNDTITQGAPFTVNGTSYMFWHLAMEASASTGKPTILAITEYTLPTTLEANGLRVVNSHVSGTNGTLTYKIGNSAQLLIPYSTSDDGEFDETPENGASGYYNTQSKFRTLKVPASTTIECSGKINVNSQVFVDTAYSGAPGGPYGCINLLASTSEINMKSGSNLYCYGYIIGDGTVTAESGATIYESFQALGWRGGSCMLDWADKAGVTGNTKTINSFAFSDYAIQNIEADLLVNYGATVNAVASLEASLSKQTKTAAYIVPDNGTSDQSGLVQLYDKASLRRSYDADNDRITYKLYGTVDIGKIRLSIEALELFGSGMTLDTSNHIFALGRNMDFEITSGSVVTLLYNYKLMPSSKITIHGAEASNATPGKLMVAGNLYIYDTVDAIYDLSGTTYSYTYHQSGHKDVNSIPVPYIATTGVGSNFYSNIWYGQSSTTDPVLNSNTPCAQVIANGVLEVNGGLWTTSSGGKDAEKVLKGTGTFINNATSATSIDANSLDEMFQVYEDSTYGTGVVRVPITVTPVVGLIAGLSTDNADYKCFEAKTYYGTESGYWYEYVVEAADGSESYIKEPAAASGSTSIPMTASDGTTTKSTNAVGIVGNGKTITFDTTTNKATGLSSELAYGTFEFKLPQCVNATVTRDDNGTVGENGRIRTVTTVAQNLKLAIIIDSYSHTDENPKDHVCDTCGETASECADNNSDHLCDICGATVSECADSNSDHACDICEENLTKCNDGNSDHKCDICGKALSGCIDSNNDYKCDICGATVCVDTDNDHQCDNCDGLVCAVTSIEAAYAAEIELRLGLEIPEDVLNRDNAYVVLTKDGRWGKVETKYTMGQLREQGANASGRYIVEVGIASGEMGRNITVQVADENGNYMNIVNSNGVGLGASPIYSVLDYANLTYQYGNEAQKTMMTALLTYGGYAQQKFKVDRDDPVYNLLKDHALTVPDLKEITQDTINDSVTVSGSGAGITVEQSEPFLDSRVYLRLTFALDEDAVFKNYTFMLTYIEDHVEKNMPLTATYDETSRKVYVDIKDIPAAYLDYMYTVTITNTQNNAVYTVQASVLCWVKQALIYSKDTAQLNLAKAIYYYNQAANTFFGK